jgi:hypothetical protein
MAEKRSDGTPVLPDVKHDKRDNWNFEPDKWGDHDHWSNTCGSTKNDPPHKKPRPRD